MENIIIILVLFLVLGSSVFYIYKARKKGQTCIGCPYAKQCSGKECYTNPSTSEKE